jgi:hypothetical protein
MKAGLLQRLKRLEELHPVDNLALVELQIGYLKRLPAEYTGERHIVTVDHDADGTYQWEERRGPAPRDEGQSNRPPFRVVLASPEDEPPAPGAAEIDADINE